MVHALKEIWQVLVPEGQLIDLRPISQNAPIEVVAKGRMLFAGHRVERETGKVDDAMANEAIDTAVKARWFVREYAGSFKYNTYWNTPDEMKTYADEAFTSSYIPEEVFLKTRQLMAESGEGAKIRVHRTIHISRYRKRMEDNMRNDRGLGEIA